MDDEIELFRGDDGLAVIGDPAAVERFLTAEGLKSKDLGLPRLRSTLNAAAGAAQVGSQVAANSGRWVQLTKESAELMSKYPLMKGSNGSLGRAIVTDHGKIKGIVQFAGGKGSLLANPAILAGAAGIMAQLAMQQAMDEITDYLAVIDEKVDDVLRAQKDASVAGMIGAELVIDEAMMIRAEVGHVSEITWSKVQGTGQTIATTQAYALRQLDALAEKLERKDSVSELADTVRDAATTVREWLAVIARCVQLQDAAAVLELDRVLDASADELDRHRVGIRAARAKRLELLSRSTERLMERMDAAAGTANAKVLLHPVASGAVVGASNLVSAQVVEFHERLGIEGSRESIDERRWVDAASDAGDKMLDIGTSGLEVAKDLGSETFDRAKSLSGRLSSGIAERGDIGG